MNDVSIYIDEMGDEIGYIVTEDNELADVIKMRALNETVKWVLHITPVPPPNN